MVEAAMTKMAKSRTDVYIACHGTWLGSGVGFGAGFVLKLKKMDWLEAEGG